MLDSIEELEEFLAPYHAAKERINTIGKEIKGKVSKEEYDAAVSAAYKEYTKFLVDNLEMPSFYEFNKPKELYTIRLTGEAVELVYENEIVQTLPREVESVYNIYHNLPKPRAGAQFEGDFTEIGLEKAFGRSSNSYSMPAPGNPKYRALMLGTEEDRDVSLEKMRYLDSLEIALHYLKNPTDFLSAWQFLDSHPFGWTVNRHEFKDENGEVIDTRIDWNTSGIVSKFWIVPTKDEKTGELYFMFETGGAYSPDRTQLTHDLRLDVYSDTYNEGIIKMAELVHKFYHLDGSDRENVDYEPSELELLLQERLAEIDDDIKHDSKLIRDNL